MIGLLCVGVGATQPTCMIPDACTVKENMAITRFKLLNKAGTLDLKEGSEVVVVDNAKEKKDEPGQVATGGLNLRFAATPEEKALMLEWRLNTAKQFRLVDEAVTLGLANAAHVDIPSAQDDALMRTALLSEGKALLAGKTQPEDLRLAANEGLDEAGIEHTSTQVDLAISEAQKISGFVKNHSEEATKVQEAARIAASYMFTSLKK